MAGDDDMGYRMLHSAIRMGESLGLVGNMTGILSPEYQYQQHVSGDHHPTHHLDQVDFDSVTRKTAWGLFHVDT